MPGLIVMRLQDVNKLDAKYSEILVLVNANHTPIQFSDKALAGIGYTLHPVQQNSVDSALNEAKFDSTSGTFTIPAITSAVFVVEKHSLLQNQPAMLAMGAVLVLVIAGGVYLLTRRKPQNHPTNP